MKCLGSHGPTYPSLPVRSANLTWNNKYFKLYICIVHRDSSETHCLPACLYVPFLNFPPSASLFVDVDHHHPLKRTHQSLQKRERKQGTLFQPTWLFFYPCLCVCVCVCVSAHVENPPNSVLWRGTTNTTAQECCQGPGVGTESHDQLKFLRLIS